MGGKPAVPRLAIHPTAIYNHPHLSAVSALSGEDADVVPRLDHLLDRPAQVRRSGGGPEMGKGVGIMSEPCRIGSDSLPLPQARRLDEVLHRFEDVWRAGLRPALEDYLGDTPEPERAALLRELIVVEVYYRRLGGDDPQPADYQERFPALESTWLAQEVAGRAASTADPSPLTAERAPSPGSGEEIEVAQGQISPLGTLRYHPLR